MLKQKGHILAIDHSEDVLFALKVVLHAHVEVFKTESNPANIEAILQSETFDVILLDINFCSDWITGNENFQHLKKILDIAPASVVLLITSYGDIKKSMLAIEAGANDFILKPWQNEKVLATVLSAIELRRLRQEVYKLKEKQHGLYELIDKPYSELIGISKAMKKAVSTLHDIAPSDDNVLIVGEKGTGKGLFAREMHRKSARNNEAFISINLNVISPAQLESELFGYVKGAVAHAKADKPGYLEMANKGTLFIDEIIKLPLPLQAKLLSALKKSEVTRLGANKPNPIDIRLICASNMSIKDIGGKPESVRNLLYQLNTVEIEVPPLRQRMEDIPLLADYFLNVFSKKFKKVAKLSNTALSKLLRYPWPGNVRELSLTLQNAVILSEKQILSEDDFRLTMPSSSTDSFEINTYDLKDVERLVIAKVLRLNHGNISKAALQLGLTRTSLYRRIEKHGLQES